MEEQKFNEMTVVTAENVLNYVLDKLASLRWLGEDMAFSEKYAKFTKLVGLFDTVNGIADYTKREAAYKAKKEAEKAAAKAQAAHAANVQSGEEEAK